MCFGVRHCKLQKIPILNDKILIYFERKDRMKTNIAPAELE
jgi:hypothetical protein